MSEQQNSQSLFYKNFDNVYLIAVLIGINIYFSSLNSVYLFIPLAILLTRIFVNHQNRESNIQPDSDESSQTMSRKQKVFKLLTRKVSINSDYFAYCIALGMAYYIYTNSLDLAFIILPACVLLARVFTQPNNKNLNSALYGSLGGILLLATCIYIVTSTTDSNDPPAVLVVVNALAFLGAFACWLGGLFAVIKLLKENSPLRKSKTAYASYIFVSLPPGIILVSQLVSLV